MKKKISNIAEEITMLIWGSRASTGGNQSDEWIDEKRDEWITKLTAILDNESTTKKSS